MTAESVIQPDTLELPDGWSIVPLGQVCQPVRDHVSPQRCKGLPYVGLEHLASGDPYLRHWGSSSDVVSSKVRFLAGDTLYGKLRPYLNKAAIAPFEGISSTDIIPLRPQADKVDSRFLTFALHMSAFLAYAISTTSGTNLPRTRWSSLKDFALVLPPLPEQRAIAGVLSAVRRAIEATEGVIEASRAIKKSLMRYLFTYGPVHIDQADQVPLKETEIGPIPEQWRIIALGELAHPRGGKRLPKGHAFAAKKTHFPYIRVVDLSGGTVITSHLQYLNDDDHEIIKQYSISLKDVYISIAGTIGLVGTVPPELDGANLTENAAKLVIRDEGILGRAYLAYYLATESAQREIQRRTSKTSQPKLALARIRQIPVPLPELSVQNEVSTALAAVDRKITYEGQRRAALADVFRSLLEDLMTARMRALAEV